MKIEIMVSINFMEIQMGGRSLNLEILRGGGAQAVLEIQVEGGGSKNRSWHRVVGVLNFSGITHC